MASFVEAVRHFIHGESKREKSELEIGLGIRMCEWNCGFGTSEDMEIVK